MKLKPQLIAAAGLASRSRPLRARAEDAQVRALPARQGRPAEARRRARLQGARREGDQRLDQGRDLPGRPVRQGQPTPWRALKLGTLELARGPRRRDRRPCTSRSACSASPSSTTTTSTPGACTTRKWKEDFSADMIKKTGIRMLGVADNGVRHFTNSQRPDPDAGRHEGHEDPHPALRRLQDARRVARRLRLRDSLGRAADRAAAEGGRRPGERRDQHPRRQPVPAPEVRHPGRPRLVDPRLPDQRALLPRPHADREEGGRRGRAEGRATSTAR